MRTELTRLPGDSISEISAYRREHRIEYGFGWIETRWPTGEKTHCMVAWIPGVRQTEHGMWPVYREGEPQPQCDGKTSWQWDGDFEKPTLSPSILHYVTRRLTPYERHDEETCHGYIRDGGWESC